MRQHCERINADLDHHVGVGADWRSTLAGFAGHQQTGGAHFTPDSEPAVKCGAVPKD